MSGTCSNSIVYVGAIIQSAALVMPKLLVQLVENGNVVTMEVVLAAKHSNDTATIKQLRKIHDSILHN